MKSSYRRIKVWEFKNIVFGKKKGDCRWPWPTRYLSLILIDCNHYGKVWHRKTVAQWHKKESSEQNPERYYVR